ncbi:UDP-N-acetyl-D-mannosamine dehydrogenase [Arthrobacter sulfonylureivorans]|uniref:UDP-N-acetyl-D-mannosamine dehydrogenase n=1 Tax=Arthrobacter sulfonylureivorans TaxID=2486855 RepID=A0ABY3WAI5_9MICC|nr:UDP-N-acetyl-D-mannosamine dehydrogenase [Arthrobacter sulfonylureivorans]UNK47353.1 UDP-N-acetyl-D-mannosamine dehydrogenase [Arthrobacter sulfonylureivorans]
MTIQDKKRIAVIGLGYIGLPTAVVLAVNGHDVTGVDVKQSTVEAINRGELPFVEPDLGASLTGTVAAGKLRATTSTPEAEAYIVAVPTPFKDGHTADLSFIEAAAKGIAPQLRGGELIILESTSPPGATQHMADIIMDERPDLSLGGDASNSIHVAHCPERVLPGRVMIELVENDRIVGGLTPGAAEMAKNLYSSFCKADIHITDAVTAEMAKLVENSFRDVNIAFANELSVIADKLNVDVWELIELANHHPRVNILQPGPGVGGHCIAVDPWFIVSAMPDDAKIIRLARETNDSKPQIVIDKALTALIGVESPTIAALGLAFKADIDDLRESPARDIAGRLADAIPNGQLLAVEPNILELPAELHNRKNVRLSELEPAIAAADLILLLVDHEEFKKFDTDKLLDKKVIDTRGAWRQVQTNAPALVL